MKRIISKLMIAALLAVFASSSIFAASAKVTYVKGKVEINRGNEWVSLKVGDSVNEAETISTGFQSEARLNYNGSVMAVPALSRITLETLQSSGTKETVSLKVDTGAVRSKVTHAEGKRIEYTARTPVGVASVRGTDFAVFSSGKAKVFEGAIAFYKASDYVPPAKESSGSSESEDAEGTESAAGDAAGGAAAPAADTSDSGTSAAAAESAPAADAGPAAATTPAKEIAESAPKGAQVVGAGQTSTISKTGVASKPVVEAKQKVSKVKATVASAATKEVISTSIAAAAADAGVVETKQEEVINLPQKPTTATVKVNIKIKED